MVYKWLRGNLHAHTTLSDGAHSLEELIAVYTELGYDFLSVTDHDLIAPVTPYQGQNAMLLIPGLEVSADGSHLGAVGVSSEVFPDTDRQKPIDAALQQNALVILNHPNFEADCAHWSQEDLARLSGYAGIEIYNGIVEYTPGCPTATDRWDQLLSAGHRIWGFANDDTHFEGNVGYGWNMVRLPVDAPVNWPVLRAAFLAGDFYATTGVFLEEIAWNGQSLCIRSQNADRIRFFGNNGRMLACIDQNEAVFRLDKPEPYLRAEAYGPRGSIAWTQPFYPYKDSTQ